MATLTASRYARPTFERRVLVLPPTRADAAAIQQLLAAQQIECEIAADMSALCSEDSRRLGQRAHFRGGPDRQCGAVPAPVVQGQPVWSDLPILVLSRSGAESALLAPLLRGLGNVSVVERPVRMTTLVSLLQSSLRARERQYQVRDHLIELAQAEAALREAEQTERAAQNGGGTCRPDQG